MDDHTFEELVRAQAAGEEPYLEFMRSESMSAGLYVLDAGATDGQSPHAQDEIYVVVAGRSRFTAGMRTRDVSAGDVIYVPASVEHRFHDITRQLKLIVVFAPPES